MIIGGVDLGARKAAISVFRDGKLDNVDSFEVPKSTRPLELCTLSYWCYAQLRSCDVVWIEEPLIGRGVRASLQVAHAAGAVMSGLAADVLSVNLVPVATWKKEVVGKGNASKEDVADWLYSEYSRYSYSCGSNQDRIDATCIGLYGVLVNERTQGLAEL